MKEVYLVHIKLPEVFTFEFYALIPEQRKLMKSLLEKGVVQNYAMDMERKNVWAFFEVKNEKELMDILSTFPIIKDISLEIHELAFHNMAPVSLPDVILN